MTIPPEMEILLYFFLTLYGQIKRHKIITFIGPRDDVKAKKLPIVVRDEVRRA